MFPESKRKSVALKLCTGGVCFLCAVLFLFAVVLLLSVIFVGLEVPHGFESLSLRVLTRDVISTVVIPFVVYVGEIVKSLFPWPILVVLAAAMVIWGPDQARDFIAALKFEAGGFKFETTRSAPDAFKRELGDAQRFTTRTNKEIEQAYGAAKEYVVQLRERFKIDVLTTELASQIAGAIGQQCPDDFRVTIYIPDLIFDDQLYQLVEYYDKRGKQVSDGKFGRAFSIRYGIIGRVWRSGVPEVEGELISAEDRALIKDLMDSTEVEKFIARRWGLTLDEAARIRSYQSYGAIRIDRGERSPGLIYFNSETKNAFGDSDVHAQINKLVQNSELAVGLLGISREISQFTRIRIFRSR